MARYQPALLGGLAIGVLSSVPGISAANVCCCLWVVAGGVLVTYLKQQATPDPVATSDAALGGLLAGAIGGVITTIVNVFVIQATGPQMWAELGPQLDNAQMPPEARQFMERMLTGPGFGVVIGFITVPIFSVFAMAGSFLGLAFFRKKLPPVPQA